MSLFLASCGTPLKDVESTFLSDLPDAALVQPCDTSETDPATNQAMSDELTRTREQRDGCATQVDGVRQWREGAVRRAAEANQKAAPR